MPEYPIHPLAAAFRLMHDYEFEVLVEGIRKKGLLVPITLAKWIDKDTDKIVEGIIDGRNREDACKEVKVKPRYQNFRGSGNDGIATEEEIADYIEQSNARKNHTLDQIAMGIAILYPKGEIGRYSKDKDLILNAEKSSALKQNKAETQEGFQRRVRFARYVQHHRNDLVPDIIKGTAKPLSTIAQEIRNDQKKERERLAAIEELRKEAPDLAQDIDEKTLDLKKALKELKRRQEEEEAIEAIREESEELARQIENDELTIDEAEELLAEQEEEKARQEKYEEDLKKLRGEDEDLADLVVRNELTLTEAQQKHQENREKRIEKITNDGKLKDLEFFFPPLAEKVKTEEMTIDQAWGKKVNFDQFSKQFVRWKVKSLEAISLAETIEKEMEQNKDFLSMIKKAELESVLGSLLDTANKWQTLANQFRENTSVSTTANQFYVVGGNQDE